MDNATCAAIHEALAGSPLAAKFAEIERTAKAVPLVGYFDHNALIEELEYRLENNWYKPTDEVEEAERLKRVRNMTDAEITKLHYRAGDKIQEALYQSPISFVIEEIE